MPPLIPYEGLPGWTAAHETHRARVVRQPPGGLVPQPTPAPMRLGARPWPRLHGEWTTTGAGTESVGQQRLRALRHLAGSGLWRTAKLVRNTVDAAVHFLLAFESVGGDLPQPRIAPVDDGSIMMEWERGQRELLVEVGPAGQLDVLQVEGGSEIREGAAEVAEARSLARWISSARG